IAVAEVVVLAAGNLGLVYLMGTRQRLTLEEIDDRYPDLLGSLREHPHLGWLLVHSELRGPVVLGARGARYLSEGDIEGDDPLSEFSPTAPRHLLRTDGFRHAPDVLVGSFYDPTVEEGCAFEELISFHGGIGGPQTRPFLLYPAWLPLPDEPLVGAESVHHVLARWRWMLNAHSPASAAEPRAHAGLSA